MEPQLFLPLAVITGAVIGSFLNVVIVRLPLGQSVVTPRSRCVTCGTEIQWFDNLPVLSFLVLRGRCRECGAGIAWRYPLVEAGTAVAFALVAWRTSSIADVLVAWLFVAILIAITGIDFEHQLIPDRITLPGIVVGFLTSFLGTRVSWLESLVGVLVCGGILFAVIVLSGGGMGGGDMKLGALIGAFLGYKLALLALFLAVVLGGGIALALLSTRIRQRKDAIPFGPFLAAGGAVATFYGEAIIAWYARAFSF